MAQLRLRAGLARSPHLAQSAGPVGLSGKQAEVIQRYAFDLTWPVGGFDRLRGGRRMRRRGQGEGRAPERREDPEPPAGYRFQLPRLEEQLPVVALCRHAVAAQRLLYRRVEGDFGCAIAARPENR